VNNQIKIYNKTNSKRKKELAFLNKLKELYPNSVHIDENYRLDNDINPVYNTNSLITELESYVKITDKKRERCIQELSKIPEELRVFENTRNISVDFTLEESNELKFIEFHERQHRIDSNKRNSIIYTIDQQQIIIPRYLQRLIRDAWRWENLDNFTIIWWDWFEKKQTEMKRIEEGKHEFSLETKFRISEIMKRN